MKVSFSTLGCPEWTWEDIVATAKDFGYDGIEIRGIEKELYIPAARPFIEKNILKTKENIEKLKLEISCLTSSCYLHKEHDGAIKEAKEYINLAKRLCVPYVRVLGDTNPEPGLNVNIENVITALKEIGSYAFDSGVTVLIETNGVFANSQTLKKVMEQVNNKAVGVLWDIHHPYRFMNESIKETYNTLKEYIKHIHAKDSIIENGKIKYKMMGQGDIPIKDCLVLLKQDSYDGFISLEWVKRWYGDLEEPGIVFMQFKNYVKELWEQV